MAKDKNVKQLVAVPQAPQEPVKTQNIEIEFYEWVNDRFDDDEPPQRVKRVLYNIMGHQVGQHWVAIITSEDETIVYQAHDIKSIRVWKE